MYVGYEKHFNSKQKVFSKACIENFTVDLMYIHTKTCDMDL